MAADANNERRAKRPTVVIVAFILIGVPIAYVLSYGPAFALVLSGHLNESAFGFVYWPLNYLGEFKALRGLLHGYLGLWAWLTGH